MHHRISEWVQEHQSGEITLQPLGLNCHQRQCIATWWLKGLQIVSHVSKAFNSALSKNQKLLESSLIEVLETQKLLEQFEGRWASPRDQAAVNAAGVHFKNEY